MTLNELKKAVGTTVNITVFRKLKQLDYLTSYSHRGAYYTLRDIARFDAKGLWSCQSVWFSRYRTLLRTAESFVNQSPKGHFPEELAEILHVQVHDTLLQLVEQRRIARQLVSGLYLYSSITPEIRQRQLLTRRTAEAIPVVADADALEISPDALKAAIILFCSLLDEQQRRLFAGIESLRLGRGGERQLGEFLGLDPHTVARGRQQLLDQNIELGRSRRPGAGRKAGGPPEILTVIERLLEHDTAGDPITGLKWSRRTIDKIAECLREKRLVVSPTTVARLLRGSASTSPEQTHSRQTHTRISVASRKLSI